MQCPVMRLILVALCCTSMVVASWHELRRPAVRMESFDRKVLGKLPNSSVGRPRQPRSHSFVTTFAVGVPPQPMQCLLDTGFADLWVPKRCKGCDRGRGFDWGDSETFIPAYTRSAAGPKLWDPVEVNSRGKKLLGYLAQDTVTFGTGTFRNQSLFAVEGAELPRKRDWDGICGLGRYQIATAGAPLWGRIAAASHGGHSVFAFVPGPNQKAYFLAGEVPYTACKEGTLSWAKTVPMQRGGRSNFWVISGGLAIHQNTPVQSKFLIDTGTAFLLAPPSKYFLFIRSLFPVKAFTHLCGLDEAAGGLVVCDCAITRTQGLLPLRVFIGERAFMMDVADLFRRVPTGTGGELCLLQIQANPMNSWDPLDIVGDLLGNGAVSEPGVDAHEPGLLIERDDRFWMPRARLETAGTDTAPIMGPTAEELDKDFWVLGSVFLEKFVTIFDFENSQVGVAEAADKIVLPSYLHSSPKPANTASPPAQLPIVAAEGRAWQPTGVKALRAGATPPHDMPRVMADVPGMDSPVVPPVHVVGSPDHQQHVSWPGMVLCAGIAAGAAGSAFLYKKLNRRKNSFLDPREPPIAEGPFQDPAAE
mmetsp:Transcript_11350/g.35129  ORF Transcript_11350/g.35129 Transcript_11350/m.35129 type:complete len:589 (-) Transcript_11350:154-1920(-)